eukprot:GEMP01005749.1.p1 GENE.GEMP01005749.1~~GEMP01005749.1.p1  ORF type:complete len:986 (+),score=245.16 GEMP01005749.1:340-3297(+)
MDPLRCMLVCPTSPEHAGELAKRKRRRGNDDGKLPPPGDAQQRSKRSRTPEFGGVPKRNAANDETASCSSSSRKESDVYHDELERATCGDRVPCKSPGVKILLPASDDPLCPKLKALIEQKRDECKRELYTALDGGDDARVQDLLKRYQRLKNFPKKRLKALKKEKTESPSQESASAAGRARSSRDGDKGTPNADTSGDVVQASAKANATHRKRRISDDSDDKDSEFLPAPKTPRTRGKKSQQTLSGDEPMPGPKTPRGRSVKKSQGTAKDNAITEDDVVPKTPMRRSNKTARNADNKENEVKAIPQKNTGQNHKSHNDHDSEKSAVLATPKSPRDRTHTARDVDECKEKQDVMAQPHTPRNCRVEQIAECMDDSAKIRAADRAEEKEASVEQRTQQAAASAYGGGHGSSSSCGEKTATTTGNVDIGKVDTNKFPPIDGNSNVTSTTVSSNEERAPLNTAEPKSAPAMPDVPPRSLQSDEKTVHVSGDAAKEVPRAEDTRTDICRGHPIDHSTQRASVQETGDIREKKRGECRAPNSKDLIAPLIPAPAIDRINRRPIRRDEVIPAPAIDRINRRPIRHDETARTFPMQSLCVVPKGQPMGSEGANGGSNRRYDDGRGKSNGKANGDRSRHTDSRGREDRSGQNIRIGNKREQGLKSRSSDRHREGMQYNGSRRSDSREDSHRLQGRVQQQQQQQDAHRQQYAHHQQYAHRQQDALRKQVARRQQDAHRQQDALRKQDALRQREKRAQQLQKEQGHEQEKNQHQQWQNKYRALRPAPPRPPHPTMDAPNREICPPDGFPGLTIGKSSNLNRNPNPNPNPSNPVDNWMVPNPSTPRDNFIMPNPSTPGGNFAPSPSTPGGNFVLNPPTMSNNFVLNPPTMSNDFTMNPSTPGNIFLANPSTTPGDDFAATSSINCLGPLSGPPMLPGFPNTGTFNGFMPHLPNVPTPSRSNWDPLTSTSLAYPPPQQPSIATRPKFGYGPKPETYV